MNNKPELDKCAVIFAWFVLFTVAVIGVIAWLLVKSLVEM